MEKTSDWDKGRVHVETFGGSKITPAGADFAFDAELARSHRTIGVGKGETILELRTYLLLGHLHRSHHHLLVAAMSPEPTCPLLQGILNCCLRREVAVVYR